ncbi:hypothetical protein XENOCAPTIV_021887 [Xenoophorus captivus]|uniref:Uncharacterized protein n=1 Tax=Xenoophorus captivus TaxID=1517983 RepID=A0ABV0SA23_9TELE
MLRSSAEPGFLLVELLHVFMSSQTVLNTMCGYGMQQEQKGSAKEHIFTIGCLEKIIMWAQNNLLLVCMMSLAGAQIAWVQKVQRRQKENEAQSRDERKERLWFPAFADFDGE